MKNCPAVTLLPAGAPSLLMGDEVRRTQRGNNNSYCQGNDMVNACSEALTCELPLAPGVHQAWRRAIDTFLEPRQEICVLDETYEVQPGSRVALLAVRLPVIGQGVPFPQ